MRPKNPQQTKYSPARGEILKLFPQTLFRGFMPIDLDVVADDVRSFVQKVKDKGEQDKYSNYTTYFDADIRNEQHGLPWWNTFANIVKDSYIEFIRTQWNSEVHYLNRKKIHLYAWMNRYEKIHAHPQHNHVNSMVSGTWYIKTQGLSPIKFTSPSATTDFGTKANMYNYDCPQYRDIKYWGTEGVQTEASIHPRDGEFLLWPSSLFHGVEIADAGHEEYERISISFNLSHNERLGDTGWGDQMSYSFLEDK